MKTYEPNAVALDSFGKPIKLFTCQPCFTKAECKRQFALWTDTKEGYGYKLLSSWIAVTYESGAKHIIAMKIHRENFFG